MRTSAPAISTSCSASPPATPRARQFLTDLTLDPPSATSDEAGAPLLDEDYLILSTIHSAKGQEWKAVYVLNVVDGCIPSDMATGNSRGDRGGAPPALRRHDPGEGHPGAGRSPALLHARPGQARRQARLCGAHALHPGPDCRPFRDAVVADGRPGPATRRAADTQPPSISPPACAACGAAPGRDEPAGLGPLPRQSESCEQENLRRARGARGLGCASRLSRMQLPDSNRLFRHAPGLPTPDLRSLG